MICFSDQALDETIRKYSRHGINKDTYTKSKGMGKANYKWLYDVKYVGMKAHGNSIMAALGIVQHYADCLSSRHLFQIRVPGEIRDRLIAALNERCIFPGVHYRINTDYRMYKYAKGTCPNHEKASQEIVTLPLHLRLTDEDVAHVSTSICDITPHLKA